MIFLNIVSSKCCLCVPAFSPHSPPALPNFDVTFHPSFERAYAALQSLFRDVCSLVWGVPHTLVLCWALGICSPSGSTLGPENVGWVLSEQRAPLPVAPLTASCRKQGTLLSLEIRGGIRKQRKVIKVRVRRTSLVAQLVKNPPVMQETQVPSLAGEDPLEKEMATHSSILAGQSHGQRSLVDYSPWGHKELDMT